MKTASSFAASAQNETGSNPHVPPLPDSYETAVAELEGLVARMEDGALSLEALLAAYRRGAALVAFCQQQLEKVEQQVRVLDGEMLKPLSVNAGCAPSGDD